MATYQIAEMIEIQETGETTRPHRAPGLKAFEQAHLDPLTADLKAEPFDVAKFDTDYDAAVAGCNSCHAAETGPYGGNFKFVKITRPAAPHFQNVDWAGQ